MKLIRKLLGVAAVVASMLTPVMAQSPSTKATLYSQVTSGFPDQSSGGITPAIMRSMLNNMIASYQQFGSVNAQTGTSYTVLTTDYGKLVTFSSGSAIAVTLPQATGPFGTFNWYAVNKGAGTVTITPTISTINSAASLSLPTGHGVWVVSDGVNYQIAPFSNDLIVGTTAISNGLTFGVLYNNAGVLGNTAAGTAGYALIGNGAAAPTFQGFVQSGTGAVTRTWQDKGRDVVNAKDFQVACDGSTDDTANLILADAEAAVRKAKLVLPGGLCRVTSAITPSANAHWVGQGRQFTTIYVASTSATVFEVSNGFTIEDLRIAPVTTRASGSITFHLTNTNIPARIFHVDLEAQGVNFRTDNSVASFDIDDVTTLNTVLNGIDLDVNGCFICSVRNSIFGGTPSARAFAHVVLRSVAGQIQFINTNMYQANTGMAIIPGNGQVVTLVKTDMLYLDSAGSISLQCAPAGTGIIQRLVLHNSWISGSAGKGVQCIGGGSTTVDEITFDDVEFLSNVTSSIEATSVTRLTVSKSRFYNTPIAISLDAVVGAILNDNVLVGTITTGLSMVNGTDYVNAHHNDMRGAATPVTNTATGTHNRITDNPGYNPVGVTAAATMGASPTTITAGPTRETHYVRQSATNTGTCTKGGQQIATLAGATTYYTFDLGPNEAYVCTWVTTAPTYTKDVH